MSKKTSLNEEDRIAFEEAIKGVKPLANDKVRLNKIIPKKSRIPAKENMDMEEKSYFPFSEHNYLEPVQAEDFISYKKIGVQNKILHKLRKGQYNVDAILDLHGMTVDRARNAVDDFLRQCLQANFRVGLIIHGKGHQNQMPILKNKLNHWLRETDQVVAFCSAAPAHGNKGAMYILLKRNSGEKNS